MKKESKLFEFLNNIGVEEIGMVLMALIGIAFAMWAISATF